MNKVLKFDYLMGLMLGSAGLLYLFLMGAFSGLPFEDAAILMRYVEHLAQGEGIVWNPGEAPIDGATDFLFLLLAGVLQNLGMSTEAGVQSLSVFGYLGTICLVYIAWRRHGHPSTLSAIIAGMLLFGAPYAYIEAYFATTFFAFLGAVLAFFALELLQSPNSKPLSVCFGLSSLLLGLCRPEGVLLSFFILISLLIYLGWQNSTQILRSYLIFLVGIGSLYLLWHYLYFGHLLPNPFYKKGGGFLYPASFRQSIWNSFRLLAPVLGLGLIRKYSSFTRADMLYVSVPVMGFCAIWVLLSNEMNYLMRFQYVLLPISLVNAAMLGKNSKPRKLYSHWKPFLYGLFVLGVYGYYLMGFRIAGVQKDGRYTVAQILNTYKGNSYGLATTEAGLLPFYSQWRSLDTWGLNDHKIASEGVITRNYLASFDPELIMFDAFTSGVESLRGSTWNSYGAMIDTLDRYVLENDYLLAAKFPDSQGHHAHFYYIKKGFPDHDSLLSAIRTCNYYWYEDGTVSLPEFPK